MANETPLSDVRFLTVAEVATIMRVSKMTVYRLVHSGELEAIRVGRSFRVPEQAVNQYLRAAFVGTLPRDLALTPAHARWPGPTGCFWRATGPPGPPGVSTACVTRYAGALRERLSFTRSLVIPGVCPPPVRRWVMACPSAVVPKGWWPDGLSHQEAPQAYGEEEAPQASEEDAHPAQEQEVAHVPPAAGRAAWSRGCARRVPAFPRAPKTRPADRERSRRILITRPSHGPTRLTMAVGGAFSVLRSERI
jgi:excisionase family DNA binding protein